MHNALYFLAIIPPLEIAEEVTGFKEYAAVHFNTSRALRSPAHITIIPPFKWPQTNLAELKAELKKIATKTESFYISLTDFDCFSPRVIFVDIATNRELVKIQAALQQQLEQNLGIENRSQFGFHPHMTVAFKDLSKNIFSEAWAYFSKIEYQRLFAVQDFCLLKHNGQIWEVDSRFKFKI